MQGRNANSGPSKKRGTRANNQGPVIQPEAPVVEQPVVAQEMQPDAPQPEVVAPVVEPPVVAQEIQPDVPQPEVVAQEIQPDVPQPEVVAPADQTLTRRKPVAFVLQLSSQATSMVLRRLTPTAPALPVMPPQPGAQPAQEQPAEKTRVVFWHTPAFWTFLSALLPYVFYAVLAFALYQGVGTVTASVSNGMALLRQACRPPAPLQQDVATAHEFIVPEMVVYDNAIVDAWLGKPGKPKQA
jgi:hypothetical protein